MTSQEQLNAHRALAEGWLGRCLRNREPRGDLYDAMEYSLLAGGKRIRPVLTLECCRMCGGEPETALPLAGAVEMIHTYSLIHDDLPCMDDDDMRRGRPTCHTVYGEATAVLAGDALLAEAFRMIAEAPGLSCEQKTEAVGILARACGGDGMVAGQLLDVEQIAANEDELRLLCRLKTGAMIQAAAELGCVAAGASPETRPVAAAYGGHIGLAFQVRDDMLNVTASEAELGKPVGSDRAECKKTFVDVLGLEGCGAVVAEETRLAKEALAGFENAEFLSRMADTLADRRM